MSRVKLFCTLSLIIMDLEREIDISHTYGISLDICYWSRLPYTNSPPQIRNLGADNMDSQMFSVIICVYTLSV